MFALSFRLFAVLLIEQCSNPKSNIVIRVNDWFHINDRVFSSGQNNVKQFVCVVTRIMWKR